MSPKELQYVKDALGHAQQLETDCSTFASQIQDQELKTFVQGLSTKHQQAFGKFYSLLNN